MSSEQLDLEAWLYQTLHGDAQLVGLATGGVWRQSIPESSRPPAVAYRALSPGVDTQGVGPTRVMTRSVYLVEGIIQDGDLSRLAGIVDRIDQLLQGASGTTPRLVVYAVRRTQPWSQDEPGPGGVTYNRAGGLYELTVGPPA